MDIYPSILETSKETFFAKLELLLPHFDHFQIDITDGIFVPGKTVQIEELYKLFNEKPSFAKASASKAFEFHLMVKDYEKEIIKLEKLSKYINITNVLVHLSTLVLDPSTPLRSAQDDNKWEYGIVLNPEDEVTPNWDTIETFKTVQLMTVHPGQQGGPFLPNVLFKISELRERGFKGKIILDGAMNDTTLPQVLENSYLPDSICPGSYFKENVEERLNKLKNMLSK